MYSNIENLCYNLNDKLRYAKIIQIFEAHYLLNLSILMCEAFFHFAQLLASLIKSL